MAGKRKAMDEKYFVLCLSNVRVFQQGIVSQ
jgi:hypothetical protein